MSKYPMEDKFDREEQNVICELARIALADAEIYDSIAEDLDLSDEALKVLQNKLETFMKGD
jgi:hypothetical protein